MLKRIALFLLLSNVACTKPFKSDPDGTTTSVESTTVTAIVTFESAPASSKATFAWLKYNKQATFQFEVDDNNKVILDPYIFCTGGTASNGITYPGKTFSDGCGNPVNWRGGLAMNARGNYNNNDIWLQPNRMSASEVATLVRSHWSVLNHGYYHDLTGNYIMSSSATASAAGNDLIQNVFSTYKKLLAQGIEFSMRAVVNPSNHPGFTKAADSLNLLASTSTGALDGYSSYPKNTSLNIKNNGAYFAQEETLPSGFIQMLRNLQDTWSTANVDYLKSQFDDLMAKSSPTKHLTMRLGTHTATFSGVMDLFNHADSVDADKVWFVGFHEYLEYREVRRLCIMSQQLVGNVLTIQLDLGAVPANNRFRDMSLLIDGGTITGVSITGADRYTYNTNTGLINIFKLKTRGYNAP